MGHTWKETTLQGFQAYHCEHCGHYIVAFPHEDLGDGGSMYFPDEKIVLVGKEKITMEDVNRMVELWEIPCKIG